MADVDLDLDRIAQTASTCRGLKDEFDNAEDFADDLAGATGHDGLKDKVEQFGNDWGNAREGLSEGLKGVADFMQAIVDTFTDLDTDMAGGVEVEHC